jgi:hypothetical protein
MLRTSVMEHAALPTATETEEIETRCQYENIHCCDITYSPRSNRSHTLEADASTRVT